MLPRNRSRTEDAVQVGFYVPKVMDSHTAKTLLMVSRLALELRQRTGGTLRYRREPLSRFLPAYVLSRTIGSAIGRVLDNDGILLDQEAGKITPCNGAAGRWACKKLSIGAIRHRKRGKRALPLNRSLGQLIS
jgi:hypothetical protein